LIPPANFTDTTTQFGLTALQGASYHAKRADNYTYTPDITIFAPNNAAFEKLGSAIFSNMTLSQLARITDYHVLPQLIFSSDFVDNATYLTQNGLNLTIHKAGNNRYINSAQLLQSDILIANGVIHIIDNVLNPNESSAVPNVDIATQSVAFPSATSTSLVPFLTDIPCTVSCPVTSTTSSAAAGTAKTTTTTALSTSATKNAGARETGFGVAGLAAAVGLLIL
jgi:transforming growth factor-beta-induced protein